MKSWEPLHSEKQDDIHERFVQVPHTNDYGSGNPVPVIGKPGSSNIPHNGPILAIMNTGPNWNLRPP